MNVAIVAWNPRSNAPGWLVDGPLLPIELTNCASEARVLAVLSDAQWVRHVPARWRLLQVDSLEAARTQLAGEEQVQTADIAYLKGQEPDGACLHSLTGAAKAAVVATLRQWAAQHHVDAVIWSDTASNVRVSENQDLAVERVRAQGPAAEQYVRAMPAQIWTAVRESLAMRGWSPIEPPPTAITTAEDLRFKDWQESRTTAGRMDTTLVDLRKVGFSLVTSLLTAGAFLGYLGVGTGKAPADVRASVFIAIMVLIAALYSLDTYYQVLLSGAVERAQDLEAMTQPWIRITKYLTYNATKTKVGYVTLLVYLTLLATGEALGLLALQTDRDKLTFTFDWSHGVPFCLWTFSLIVDAAIILALWDRRRWVAAGIPLSWIALALGLYLWDKRAPEPIFVWVLATVAVVLVFLVTTRLLWQAVVVIASSLGIGAALQMWENVGPQPAAAWLLVAATLAFFSSALIFGAKRYRPAIASLTIAWLTVGLWVLLWEGVGKNLPGVLIVVGAGGALALYIQLYWIYCGISTNLFVNKPGRWPEGSNEKIPGPVV